MDRKLWRYGRDIRRTVGIQYLNASRFGTSWGNNNFTNPKVTYADLIYGWEIKTSKTQGKI